MILIFLLFFKAIFAKHYENAAKKLVSDDLFKKIDTNFLEKLRFNETCDPYSMDAAAECEKEFKFFS